MSDSKSLIGIIKEASALDEALVMNGGEIGPELEALLEVKDVQLPAKVDSYSLIIDKMKMTQDFYKTKADFFLKLAKAAGSIQDRLKDNLQFAMQELGTDELIGFDMRFKLQNSPPSCVIENETLIPQKYIKTEIVKSIDKKQILADLKDGKEISGARMEVNQHVRPYANTPTKAPKKKVV